jgi:ribosome-binding protein aMBF1 (putative translation factor)
MSKKTNLHKLDELTSNKSSGWLEKANWRKANASWLDVSSKIALRILRALRERDMSQRDLAEKMGVSPQYINKILKGSENLSLETISTFGKALSIDLFSAFSENHVSIDEPDTIPLTKNRGNNLKK